MENVRLKDDFKAAEEAGIKSIDTGIAKFALKNDKAFWYFIYTIEQSNCELSFTEYYRIMMSEIDRSESQLYFYYKLNNALLSETKNELSYRLDEIFYSRSSSKQMIIDNLNSYIELCAENEDVFKDSLSVLKLRGRNDLTFLEHIEYLRGLKACFKWEGRRYLKEKLQMIEKMKGVELVDSDIKQTIHNINRNTIKKKLRSFEIETVEETSSTSKLGVDVIIFILLILLLILLSIIFK